MSTLFWPDHIEGTWAADDLRRAFVMGAKWWEWQKEGATMWPSNVREAEAQAEIVFPGGNLPELTPLTANAFRGTLETVSRVQPE